MMAIFVLYLTANGSPTANNMMMTMMNVMIVRKPIFVFNEYKSGGIT